LQLSLSHLVVTKLLLPLPLRTLLLLTPLWLTPLLLTQLPLLLTQPLLSNCKARREKKRENDRWASGLAVFFYYLVE
jgi:hypothetical protein